MCKRPTFSIIYVWSTAVFGLRFSDLTHRGIITHGPYRWVKTEERHLAADPVYRDYQAYVASHGLFARLFASAAGNRGDDPGRTPGR